MGRVDDEVCCLVWERGIASFDVLCTRDTGMGKEQMSLMPDSNHHSALGPLTNGFEVISISVFLRLVGMYIYISGLAYLFFHPRMRCRTLRLGR